MKKKRIFTTMAVMCTACAMLIGNAVMVSGFLSHEANENSVTPVVAAESIAYSEVNVPTLKLEPAVPVLTANEYLEKVMSQEEIQKIYEFLDNSKSVAFGSTRDLTDLEVTRRMLLEDQYLYDGLRPKNPLPFIAGNYDLYFDMASEIYHYPIRDLTDEELLQIIDWGARINYALSLRYEPTKPNSKDISESEAIALAIESIEKLFGVDTAALEIIANFTEFNPQKSQWTVLVKPYKMSTLQANGEIFWMYTVFINPLSGDVIDTTRACLVREKTKITETEVETILNDDSWLHAAESIVVEKQGETRKISEIYVDMSGNPILKDGKFVNDAFNSERGIVDVVVVLEDGAMYIVSMYYPDQSLRCLLYEK